MNTCEILLIVGYLFICFTAFTGHLVTLFFKIKNGDKWTENSGFSYSQKHYYKFSFYENVVGWGFMSLLPVVNIFMIIYDMVYLINPFIKKLDETVNNLFGTKGND